MKSRLSPRFQHIRQFLPPITLATSVILSACAPTPGLTYTVPQGLTPQTAATIIGTTNPPDPYGVIHLHLITYVIAIDNLQTNDTSDNSNTPVLVTPGNHIIQIGACDADFLGSCDWYGTATLAATLAAGQTYTLRVQKDPPKRVFHDYRIRHTWIEDSVGTPITPTAPMADNNPTSSPVPIFIPVK